MPRHTEGPWMPSDDISRSSKSGLSSCSLHDLIALNPSVVDQITSFEVGDGDSGIGAIAGQMIRFGVCVHSLYCSPHHQKSHGGQPKNAAGYRNGGHRIVAAHRWHTRFGYATQPVPGETEAAAGLTRRAWRAAGPPRGCCSSSRAARSTRWGCVRWPSDPPGR